MLKKVFTLILIMSLSAFIMSGSGSAEGSASVKFDVKVKFEVKKGECKMTGDIDDFIAKSEKFWGATVEYGTTLKGALDKLGELVAVARAKQEEGKAEEDDKAFSEKVAIALKEKLKGYKLKIKVDAKAEVKAEANANAEASNDGAGGDAAAKGSANASVSVKIILITPEGEEKDSDDTEHKELFAQLKALAITVNASGAALLKESIALVESGSKLTAAIGDEVSKNPTDTSILDCKDAASKANGFVSAASDYLNITKDIPMVFEQTFSGEAKAEAKAE